MPEDNDDIYQEDTNTFVAAGTLTEVKTQLMMYKFMSKLNRITGNPIVINADQFRGTVNPIDKPKVTLYFLQKPEDVRGSYKQMESSVTFRLMDKSSDPGQWTDQDYVNLAEKIESKFAHPLFFFARGKEIVTYVDKLKGYHFQIWASTKSEGHRVIEQTLDIQSHSPDLQYESHKVSSAPNEKYPDNPDKQLIRGSQKRKRRTGATGTVWYRYAFMTFPGWDEVIMLHDTSASKVNPVLLRSPQILNYNVGLRRYDQE